MRSRYCCHVDGVSILAQPGLATALVVPEAILDANDYPARSLLAAAVWLVRMRVERDKRRGVPEICENNTETQSDKEQQWRAGRTVVAIVVTRP